MALLFVTTDMLKWGVGTGAPLPAADVDNNFWQLHERVLALEENPPTAIGITNIEVDGTQMVITLADATQFGPFTLPIAVIEFRGEPVDGQPLFELDVISVIGYGLYFVREDHTFETPFDPDLTISGDPVYQLLFGNDPYRYDFGPFVPGKPGLGIADGKRLFSHIVKTDVYFLADLVGSVAKLETAPAAELVFPIRKNNAVVGSITFAIASIDGVIECDPLQLNDGDRFSLMKPTAVDAAALELTCTFVGRRGTLPP